MSHIIEQTLIVLKKYNKDNVFDISSFLDEVEHFDILKFYGNLNYLSFNPSLEIDNKNILFIKQKIEDMPLTIELRFLLTALTTHLSTEKKQKIKNKIIMLAKTDEDGFKSLLHTIKTVRISEYKQIISILSFNI